MGKKTLFGAALLAGTACASHPAYYAPCDKMIYAKPSGNVGAGEPVEEFHFRYVFKLEETCLGRCPVLEPKGIATYIRTKSY